MAWTAAGGGGGHSGAGSGTLWCTSCGSPTSVVSNGCSSTNERHGHRRVDSSDHIILMISPNDESRSGGRGGSGSTSSTKRLLEPAGHPQVQCRRCGEAGADPDSAKSGRRQLRQGSRRMPCRRPGHDGCSACPPSFPMRCARDARVAAAMGSGCCGRAWRHPEAHPPDVQKRRTAHKVARGASGLGITAPARGIHVHALDRREPACAHL
jgi:hypothetical protein